MRNYGQPKRQDTPQQKFNRFMDSLSRRVHREGTVTISESDLTTFSAQSVFDAAAKMAKRGILYVSKSNGELRFVSGQRKAA